MDRLRLQMCLKRLNEAKEQLTSSDTTDYTASDLRLLDALETTIETCSEVMAVNRAIEKATNHRSQI